MAVHLERIDRHPTSPVAARPPLLFVHGAYCAAWCWDEHFLPFLRKMGGLPQHLVSKDTGAAVDKVGLPF